MHFIAFTRLTWSDAFCRHDAFWSGCIFMYSLAFWRIRYRAHHTMCIKTQSKRQGMERSLMKTWMACRCYIGTRSQPVQSPSGPCFHVSLALSPLGVSCVCMCGPRVRRIYLHFGAFWCILVHFNAFCAFSRIHKSGSSAVVNWNTNLCKFMQMNAS